MHTYVHVTFGPESHALRHEKIGCMLPVLYQEACVTVREFFDSSDSSITHQETGILNAANKPLVLWTSLEGL